VRITVNIPAPKNSRFSQSSANSFVGEDVRLGRAVIGVVESVALGRNGAYLLLDCEVNDDVKVLTDASLTGLGVTRPA